MNTQVTPNDLIDMASDEFFNDGLFNFDKYIKDKQTQLDIKIAAKREQTGIIQGNQVSLCYKNSLTVQFSHPNKINPNTGKKQQMNPSFGKLSKASIDKAYDFGMSIIDVLFSETRNYFDDWYYKKLGKDSPEAKQAKINKIQQQEKEKENNKTFHDMYIEIMNHWERHKKTLQNEYALFKNCYSHFKKWENNDNLFNEQSLDGWIKSKNQSGITKNHLQRLLMIFDFDDKPEIKKLIKKEIESINKILVANKKRREQEGHKLCYLPDVNEVIAFWNEQKSITFGKNGRKLSNLQLNRKQCNLNLYAILAIYGLRCHEAFNIINWDKPVMIKNNDFILLDNFNENEDEDTGYIEITYQGNDKIIPAINDPNNEHFILVIKETVSSLKTGKRLAIPYDIEWLTMFKLLGIPFDELLPNTSHNIKSSGVLNAANSFLVWLNNNKCPFTSHKLRHLANSLLHDKGLNPMAIANSLGHSLQMNQQTYLSKRQQIHKLETLTKAIENNGREHNQVEALTREVDRLKHELDQARTENKLLKALLEQKALNGL